MHCLLGSRCYCLGAAACQQAAGRQAADVWASCRFAGLSSGAVLAVLPAADVDVRAAASERTHYGQRHSDQVGTNSD